jgi:hypothetical protein
LEGKLPEYYLSNDDEKKGGESTKAKINGRDAK